MSLLSLLISKESNNPIKCKLLNLLAASHGFDYVDLNLKYVNQRTHKINFFRLHTETSLIICLEWVVTGDLRVED